VVDDDAFNREGLRAYLGAQGFTIVEAADESSALAVAKIQHIDVAVVDISIPPNATQRVKPTDSYGLSLAQTLKTENAATGVVLFSAYEDRGDDVLRMIKSGARGLAYKLKGCTPNELLGAIRDVLAGRVLIDPLVTGSRAKAMAAELLAQLSADEREPVRYAAEQLAELTPREREIALRIAASQNVKGIAAALHLAPKSVENAITAIYGKLGLNQLPGHLREVVILAKACLVNDLEQR
jgi:DNA-binding NarL/FixJ family response regulator